MCYYMCKWSLFCFFMFIFPSKLKLNLSRVLLNIKTIFKIWFFLYFKLFFVCLFVLFLVCLLFFFLRGGVGKSAAPVRSLRDLMQEEEQQLFGKKVETKEAPSASTSKANKSGTPRKKLKYDTPPHYPFRKLDISHVFNVSRRTQFVTEHRCLITKLTSPKFH